MRIKERKKMKHGGKVNIVAACRFASAVTRSTGDSLTAWPLEDLAPRMHCTADLRRLNEMEHLSQYRVEL